MIGTTATALSSVLNVEFVAGLFGSLTAVSHILFSRLVGRFRVRSVRVLNTNISRGSVSTRLSCGGIFNVDFIADLLLSVPVK